MTQISPRVAHDLSAHYMRMNRAARRQRLAFLARDLVLALAILAFASLSGWALGVSSDTFCALPQVVAQSQTLSPW